MGEQGSHAEEHMMFKAAFHRAARGVRFRVWGVAQDIGGRSGVSTSRREGAFGEEFEVGTRL